MLFTGAELSQMVGAYFWPLVRISALLLAMPVFNSQFVPPRVRLMLAIGLTMVIAPIIPQVPAVDALSLNGMFIILQQILIGVLMGYIFHMVFAVFTIGGQIVAMQMGLGFSTMVDPVNGAQVPVLSMFYILLVTLFFFLLNGHLALIGVLSDSFTSLPIGAELMPRDNFWLMVSWATDMFKGAILVALPAVTALLLVNMSLGVIGRAAPQLNIFAVGFSITIAAGFYVILVSLPVVLVQFENVSTDAFSVIKDIVNLR
ncbi:MAG: flagellar biosynthetic protein FliR [Gammaproteobacteria bacterium]|nr:flagellar biosynthetic protein FliR [Gammaproteobacteria bacterium]